MNTEFKREVMECMEEFALAVRMNRDFEEMQLDKLKDLLSDLAEKLRNENAIDKDLALDLYGLPQIVRNMFFSYEGPVELRPERFNRLEDAWIDLDALVLECLQPSGA